MLSAAPLLPSLALMGNGGWGASVPHALLHVGLSLPVISTISDLKSSFFSFFFPLFLEEFPVSLSC